MSSCYGDEHQTAGWLCNVHFIAFLWVPRNKRSEVQCDPNQHGIICHHRCTVHLFRHHSTWLWWKGVEPVGHVLELKARGSDWDVCPTVAHLSNLDVTMETVVCLHHYLLVSHAFLWLRWHWEAHCTGHKIKILLRTKTCSTRGSLKPKLIFALRTCFLNNS